MNGETEFVERADPVTGLTVRYALPVFQEIEFQVGDGFRRIPRGGIEIGGILLGQITGSTVNIEAFEPIECEHAYGPSFQLSSRDLDKLETQISAQRDKAVGWFVSRSRSDLKPSAAEMAGFPNFFPRRGSIMLLVKPEKFKATKFATLIYDGSGNVLESGEPFTLPQPKRSQTNPPPPRPAPVSAPEPVRIEPPQPPSPAPLVEVQPTAPLFHAPKLQRTDAAIPIEDQPEPKVKTSAGALTWILLLGAILFALLTGYGWFLRLTPSTIAITLTPNGNVVTVTWPPDQTRDADSAEIRVNNGPLQQLTSSQKIAATFSVPANGGDTMVELTARHRFYTAHGIARLLAPAR